MKFLAHIPVTQLLGASVVLSLCGVTPGLALAASADQLPDIQHTVQAGDTLEAVAKRYLKDPQQWREIGTINQIAHPTRLSLGSVIVIPARLVGYQNVTIEHIQGNAETRSPVTGNNWKALGKGDTLTEGDELKVPAGSFVTLKFADGSSVRINEKSELKLSELRKNARTEEQHSVLQLDKGGLESHVIPTIEQRRKRKFEIKTPMATTSVRGTVFSVSLSDDGNAVTAVDKGLVAVAGDNAKKEAQVAAGSGIAVQANGQLGSVVPQLHAPSLQNNPAVFEDADFLTIQMTPVDQARQYQVSIANDAAMAQVLRSQRFDTTTAKFEAMEDGNYYISARAIDGSNIPGMPAQQAIKVKATPIPPLYSAPTPNGLIGISDGELVCSEGANGIAGYRIQVAAQSDFAQPLLDSGVVNKCKTAINSLPAGNYFWRAASVRKTSDGQPDQGPFSKPQGFRAGSNPATLSADALNAVDTNSPNQLQLSWAAEPGQNFNLQLAQSDQFEAPISTVLLDKPQWTSEPLTPGNYFVRLQVLDPSGLKSRYSAARKMTVEPSIVTGNGSVLRSGDGKQVQSPR